MLAIKSNNYLSHYLVTFITFAIIKWIIKYSDKVKNVLCIVMFGLVLMFCIKLPGQKSPDSYFDHLFKNQKFMGSVAIAHNDSIFYSKSVGYADADKKAENNSDTKFRIGSISKTFTATLILKAVEEQKLKLSDKLESYYPDIKNAGMITIQHLLKHRSGIFNFTEIAGAREWEQAFHTEKEFLDYIIKNESNFEPGTAYEYSNTNYAFLGFILQRIYQKPYAEILDEKICKPLGLKNTYYSFQTDSTRNEAYSYNIQNSYIRNAKVNFSNHTAGGGIASSATDVTIFLSALFNGKLITSESLQWMLPATKGEYGMGIIKLGFTKPEGFKHGGRIENYISDYWYFPEERLGIVVLANAININTEDISLTLLKYAYRNLPELPDFDKTSTLTEAAFKKIKGTYWVKDKSEMVTISSDGVNMVFQSSGIGQDYIPFKMKRKNEFFYENITLKFYPEKNECHLKQERIRKVYKK